jgi:hypothetical protein
MNPSDTKKPTQDGQAADERVYRIKGWHKFQHFKDRRPPWIKLYRDILDDIEWHDLAPESAKTLIALWLIASENDGALPDSRSLAFRLRMPVASVHHHLSALSHWLEHDDTVVISDCHSTGYHVDTPEESRGESEREGEKEIEREAEPEGGGLAGLIAMIRGCRPEYSGLREADLYNVLSTSPRHLLEAMVREWCADQTNAIEPLRVPLASLRKRVAMMASRELSFDEQVKEEDRLRQERYAREGVPNG